MVSLNCPPPEGFLEPETRCEHYVSKQMKEVWAVQLDLAQKLLEVCKKYNLKIYADYGTLLGAVRHKGFIPWDEDMDFTMPREDYDKLCKIAKEEFQDPYSLENYENVNFSQLMVAARLHNSHTTAIAKSELARPNLNYNQGIFVDVFPLDKVPENKFARYVQLKMIALCRFFSWGFAYFSTRYFDSKSLLLRYPKKILYILFKFPSMKLSKFFFLKWIRWTKKYQSIQTSMYFQSNIIINPIIRHENDYAVATEVPFEYISIPINENYDNILRALYGNYNVPKKFSSAGELRMGGIIFDTNVSYTEMINRTTKGNE